MTPQTLDPSTQKPLIVVPAIGGFVRPVRVRAGISGVSAMVEFRV